ncbi:UNVERIFIED_CONTAM: hypothetical protein K2H54_047768 [Gekko kuhli]
MSFPPGLHAEKEASRKAEGRLTSILPGAVAQCLAAVLAVNPVRELTQFPLEKNACLSRLSEFLAEGREAEILPAGMSWGALTELRWQSYYFQRRKDSCEFPSKKHGLSTARRY